MDDDDPFNSFTSQCRVSSSQEQILRSCPFAREEEKGLYFDEPDSAGFPVVSAGIVMVSPPDSLEEKDENTPHDVFQTPPEETLVVASSDEPPEVVGGNRDDTVVVDDDDDDVTAVDLGRDTDLGFTEMGPIRLCDGGVSRVEVFEDAGEKFRFLKRELSLEKGLNETSLKKSKNLWKSLGLDSPIGNVEQRKEENLMISVESLNSKSENLGEMNCSDSAKKKLKFLDVPIVGSEVVDLNCEGSVRGLVSDEGKSKEDSGWKEIKEDVQCAVRNGARYEADNRHCNSDGVRGNRNLNAALKESEIGVRNCVSNGEKRSAGIRALRSIDDIDKFRYNGSSSPVCRVLPLSFVRSGENASREENLGNLFPNNVLFTFLNVLKEIGKRDCDPTGLENGSILEIAISRGMTFPRPRWWPERGFEDPEEE